MMTNYFLKLLCRSSPCRTEQQNLQQYNFNKIIQQKTCVSPKLKSHWNKNKKCSYCPSFFFFFFIFFFFRPHFLVLFSLFFLSFFFIFSTVTRSACIFFQSLICSLIFIFKFFFFFKSQVNCSFCILHFCFPSTANFISPSHVISVIN